MLIASSCPARLSSSNRLVRLLPSARPSPPVLLLLLWFGLCARPVLGGALKPPEAPAHYRRLHRITDPKLIETRRQRQVELERAVRRHPGNHALRVELACVLGERGMLHEAIRQLDRVLVSEPGRADLWAHRARWCRELGMVRGDADQLRESLRCYRRMMRAAARAIEGIGAAAPASVDRGGAAAPPSIDPVDLVHAATIALVLEDWDGVERFAGAVARHPRFGPRARLMLAAMDYRKGRLAAAAQVVDRVLAGAAGPLIDAVRGGELLAEAGSAAAAAAPAAALPQSVRLAGFWKSQDPTPTTRLNERFIEHCYRVLLADALFTRDDLPGRETDRGQVLIRYGLPEGRHVEGAYQYSYFIDRGGYLEPFTALAHPADAWSYRVGDEHLRFLFEDLSLQGDFGFTGPSAERQLVVAKRLPFLYKREVPGGLVEIVAARSHFRGHRADVLVSLAVTVDAAELTGGRARGSRGTSRSARTARATPHERGSRPWVSAPRAVWGDVEVRWAVFDPDYRQVAARSMRLDHPSCVYRDAAGRTQLLARADFDLPAGDYVMAVEFRDAVTGREGVIKREVTVEPIIGLLSDLELCRDARRAAPGSREPFVRYDAQVVPNPRQDVTAGEPLRFYYEVYGLGRAADGHRRCRIHHRVRSLEAPRNARAVFPLAYALDIDEPVARYDTDMPRVGQLDVTGLAPGRYELQVEVEDLVTGREETRALRFRRVGEE